MSAPPDLTDGGASPLGGAPAPRKTVFVTGGTGFIGSALVRRLVAQGHDVRVLARTPKSERAAAALGAEPVHGDLVNPGPWRAVAASCQWVAHLAQPLTFGGRVTRRRAEDYRVRRAVMDRHLLDALGASVERIVYVGGTSYYGDLGTELRDENASPRPRGWGPYVAPAIDALGRHLARGLPLVIAFPGYVYGDGSWFRSYVIQPLRRGKRLNLLAGPSRFGSPIHLDDCARALAFLLARGETGRRYFLVDDRPIRMDQIYRLAAGALQVRLRVRKVPAFIARILLGSVITDSMQSDTVLSNARLKALGFQLEFPTVEEGIPDVIHHLRRPTVLLGAGG